ncbi:uncharacterized protein LOC135487304 [Lineus longissimus]|uniref:uncharacterized protein LOC135487304 n=1 Tax=Lineus longissimus TaxID=88925 RepID=UPI00315CFDB2
MMIITLLSLGSTPLLYFLLGLIWHLDNIPFLQYHATRLAVWQVILIAAYTMGLILRYFNLKGVWRMVKFFLFPLSVCFVLALLAFGIYTNVYMFFIRRGWLALSALLFPWAAYFFGLLSAFAFRLPLNQIKTIAMNSGVCQPVLAMAIFLWGLPNPEADLGLYMAFIVLLASYLPLIVFSIVSVSMRFCCGRKTKEDTEKCLPTENGDTNGQTGSDNWGMGVEEGTSESEVNLELHSEATTAVIEDKDSAEYKEDL